MSTAIFIKQMTRIAAMNGRSALGTSSLRYASTEPNRMMPESQILEKTLNQVTLLGRVGGQPKRGGTDEHPFVVFSLATHNNYKYESGEVRQKTDWHRVCVFKPSLRELIMEYMKKGHRVHVTGKISYGSTKEDQNTKNLASIVADEIIFFQSFSDDSELDH